MITNELKLDSLPGFENITQWAPISPQIRKKVDRSSNFMPSNSQKKVQGFDKFWALNLQICGHQLAGASRGLKLVTYLGSDRNVDSSAPSVARHAVCMKVGQVCENGR